jgi:hypothetical protein
MIFGSALESLALVSWEAKENSHDAVARISNPTVWNGAGMNRCARDSTKEMRPPGFRVTSTDQRVGVRVEVRDLLIELLQRQRDVRWGH